MERRGRKSVSRDWRETEPLRQEEFNMHLDSLKQSIEDWNRKLEEAVIGGDREALYRIAAEAVDALNDQWKFHGDIIHVSGTWFAPTDPIESLSGISYEFEETEAFKRVPSNGFAVHGSLHEPAPRVGLSFHLGILPVMGPAAQGNLQILAFADPSKVSLIYVRPSTTEVITADMGEFAKAIDYYDKLYQFHTGNAESNFYKKTPNAQKKVLANITEKLNQALPDPGNLDVARLVYSTVPYFYCRNPNDQAGIFRANYNQGVQYVITGDILGFTLLENYLSDEAYPLKSPDDLHDPEAGVCMIVEIEEVNFERKSLAGMQILLPVRPMTTMSLQIV